MKEKIYSAPGQNQKGMIVFFVLVAFLAAFLVLFMLEWGPHWLSQTGVYLFGGGVIWVSVRYLFSAFIYEIGCYDGEWLLIVAAGQGRKATTLCRMPLYQLVSLTPLVPPAELKKSQKKAGETHRFRQNMFPLAVCQCVFDDGEKTTLLELEVDADFWQTLSFFAKQNSLSSEENENA